MIPIPTSKPKASLELVHRLALTKWQDRFPGTELPMVYVLAVRSYFDLTIAPAGNNLSAYDDAFFIVTPIGFSSWNGNTDPSRYGWNANAGKYMARLKPGAYKFIRRMHRGKYWAYGQGDNNLVTVERIRQDGSIAKTEEGLFGIDLHPGGVNGTSSEGCNTVPPPQWPAFDKTLKDAMTIAGIKEFGFILIDGPIT